MGQQENSVAYAVEQVCGLYGVQVTREQSRVFNVQGAAGRWRPMYFGEWTDDKGLKHRSGKPDFLARPRISLFHHIPRIKISQSLMGEFVSDKKKYLSVPLWIECKSKDGKQKPAQFLFQRWVEKNGDVYLLLNEDVRPLITWFEEHGVEKNCVDEDLDAVVSPIDATELYKLPCKHCGRSRAEHVGPILACPLHLAMNDTRLLGKVWSPRLRREK